MPNTRKAPDSSFNPRGTFWVEINFGLVLAKHFGACGMIFFIQNKNSPLSQSSIKLKIEKMYINSDTIMTVTTKNIPFVEGRRVFAVLCQGE